MALISLIGAVQAFFYFLLFQTKRKKALSDYILMLILILLSATFTDNYLRNTNFYNLHPQYWGITYCIPMLLGPLMYFYVALITMPVQKFKWHLWLHTLPFIVFQSYFIINYFMLPVGQQITYFHWATRYPWPMIYAAEFLLIFNMPVYAVLSLYKLKIHSKNIGLKFSYTEGINLHWLRTVYIMVLILNMLEIGTNIVSDIIPIFSYQTADNIAYACTVALTFIIGFYGFKQTLIYAPNDQKVGSNKEIITKPAEENYTASKYIKSGLHEPEAEQHYYLLIRYIESERPYLDSKLSIKTVADKLGISVNHLSQVINQKANKNFFKFINEYRIEEAKKLLSDQSNSKYTILGIAYNCGFNSKSSFNTIFKQYTGKTPSEFIEIRKHQLTNN